MPENALRRLIAGQRPSHEIIGSGVANVLREVVDVARVTGYTETILGRRRYLPDLNSDNRQRREMAERMALNAPIQGSAADVIKVAMLRVSSAIKAAGLKSRMLLQVHDELIFESAPGELDALTALVKAEMGAAWWDARCRQSLVTTVAVKARTGSTKLAA